LLLIATCGVTTAMAGVACGDDDAATPAPTNNGGSAGASGAAGKPGNGTAGTAGNGTAGSGTAGTAGTGGGTAGTGGGTAGTGGGTAGTGGTAGAGGFGGQITAGAGGTGGGAAGTGGSAGAGGSAPVGNPSLFPSAGSAVTVSEDDTLTVMVNRDVGSVSVFTTTYAADGTSVAVVKTAEVSVGAGSEPWQVALSPDGNTAYVVLRKDQKLVRISNLRATPTVNGTVAVGSEPTGLALTPSGARAWITNWVDGTITGVDTQAMAVTSTIDLNGPLAASGMLGAGATGRPGLAHPRSIAITNNKAGGDDDETLYVTEYFAQRTAVLADKGANADADHGGVVYRIPLADKNVSLIKLGALPNVGFPDSAGGTAGCFPNQLQSITVNGGFAYVTSICASPKGPIGATTDVPPKLDNIKTTTHGVVSVIDLASNAEATGATASLHKSFDTFLGDVAGRRLPLVPIDMAFVPGTNVAYVPANGSDAMFRVLYDGANAPSVGSPTQPFINLAPAAFAAASKGQLPIGVAIAKTGKKFAFVANDASRNLSVVDLNTQAVASVGGQPQVIGSTALPAAGSPEEKILRGKRFFNTGLGRWSLKGEGWGACQSCHTDGLTDNITWYFARGPRQSTSLDGSFSKKDANDQRIFNWSAIFDEVADFEGNTRGVSGGVGAIVSKVSDPIAATDRIDLAATGHAGLNGSATQAADKTNPAALPEASALEDWAEVKAYVQSIRSPRGVSAVPQATIDAGKQAFVDGACAGCHGGDKWTISKVFYTPNKTNMGALKALAWTAPGGFPTALLPASDAAKRFMRFSGDDAAVAGNFDQIQCILRPVGTFGVADASAGLGVELRQNMVAKGQGEEANGNGFNPPSLLGGVTGAPYLHAGGARTLESLFSSTFKTHYQALAPNFLTEADPAARKAKVDALVAYLTTLDGTTATIASPATAGANGGSFCAPPP
jgi:DNA-binding beta-propeller fold protein YncE